MLAKGFVVFMILIALIIFIYFGVLYSKPDYKITNRTPCINNSSTITRKCLNPSGCVHPNGFTIGHDDIITREKCVEHKAKSKFVKFFETSCLPTGKKNGKPCVKNAAGEKEIHYKCEKINHEGVNLCTKGSEVFEINDIITEKSPCVLDVKFPVC